MGKSSLTRIPFEHFSTLRDARTGALDWIDVFFQLGVPTAIGLLSAYFHWALPSVTGIITGVSIVAALLCSMAVFIFQLRLGMGSDRRLDEDDFGLVNESFHNVMWAILVGILIAVVLIVAEAAGGLKNKAWAEAITAIVVALCIHFLVVIAMCMKRLRRAYERVAMRRE